MPLIFEQIVPCHFSHVLKYDSLALVVSEEVLILRHLLLRILNLLIRNVCTIITWLILV